MKRLLKMKLILQFRFAERGQTLQGSTFPRGTGGLPMPGISFRPNWPSLP